MKAKDVSFDENLIKTLQWKQSIRPKCKERIDG